MVLNNAVLFPIKQKLPILIQIGLVIWLPNKEPGSYNPVMESQKFPLRTTVEFKICWNPMHVMQIASHDVFWRFILGFGFRILCNLS